MKVILNVVYDTQADQNIEASKLDRFRQRIYGQGKWNRDSNGGLEITL
jgi:hypothetical protein